MHLPRYDALRILHRQLRHGLVRRTRGSFPFRLPICPFLVGSEKINFISQKFWKQKSWKVSDGNEIVWWPGDFQESCLCDEPLGTTENWQVGAQIGGARALRWAQTWVPLGSTRSLRLSHLPTRQTVWKAWLPFYPVLPLLGNAGMFADRHRHWPYHVSNPRMYGLKRA